MFLYFIGTGGSEGTPNYLCKSKTCKEAQKYSFARRNPPSILLITEDGDNILIDAGTDVTDKINVELKAILLTHWHHDHIAGLYRLRWLEKPTPLYAPEPMSQEIKKNPVNLKLNPIKHMQKIKIGNIEITPFKLNHTVPTLGYLIKEQNKKLAIITDTKLLPPETEEFLKKQKPQLAVIDSIYAPGVNKPNHNNVDEACQIGKLIKAKQTILYHIAYHNLPHLELVKYVKENYGEDYDVSYDGMLVSI